MKILARSGCGTGNGDGAQTGQDEAESFTHQASSEV
jgi:hypothetical protein